MKGTSTGMAPNQVNRTKLIINIQKKNFIGGINLHPFIQTQDLLDPNEITLKNRGNSSKTHKAPKSP